jgi:hypothetical protein
VINVRMHVVGDDRIMQVLKAAPDALNLHVLSELTHIGQEIRDDARANVPVRSGRLKAAIKFQVKTTKKGSAKLDVLHSGKGARHAHLIERGVPEKVIEVRQRFRAQRLRVSTKTGKIKKGREYWERGAVLYKRRHHINPDPYFMPAVDKAGDVGARLEGALSKAAAALEGR